MSNIHTIVDNEKLFEIVQKGNLGYINKAGELVKLTSFKAKLHVANYSGAVPLDALDKLMPVKKDDKYGFLDKEGKVIIDYLFDTALSFSDGMALVGKKIGFIKNSPQYLWGYINKTGELVIDYQFVNAYSFCESVVAVEVSDVSNKGSFDSTNWGIIDKSGSFICEPKFNWISEFKEGLGVNP